MLPAYLKFASPRQLYPCLQLTNHGTLARTELPALEVLQVFGCPLLSGTIPPQMGEFNALTDLLLYNNPLLSGTIPPEIGKVMTLNLLDFGTPLLTGTIPQNLSQLVGLRTLRLDSSGVSGTIPAALCELPVLGELRLSYNGLLSGTVPHELSKLRRTLTQLHLAASPLLSGTLPLELGGLAKLLALDLHDNVRLTGTFPPLTNATQLTSLNVGNCSFSGLPSSLPTSISHLYMNQNPIQATVGDLTKLLSSIGSNNLHVLHIGFNWPLCLDGLHCNGRNHTSTGLTRFGRGARVNNPTPCHLGASCEFLLQMYDEDDQPAKVGGLVSDLTLQFDSKFRTPMRDNRDGTFTAAIPNHWLHSNGSYLFHFLDRNGVEFKPQYNLQNVLVSKHPGDQDSIRTVEFLPRQCLGSHTIADKTTGATCICTNSSFDPDKTSDNSTDLNCHRRCNADEMLSDDRGSCVPRPCTGRSYDTDLHGILLCSRSGLSSHSLDDSLTYQEALRTREMEGGRCAPCPSECTRCEGGLVTVLEGWRLNSTSTEELQTQFLAGRHGRPQWLFSCPYEKEDCPEIHLTTPLVSVDTVRCRNKHSGPLCATCKEGYSRRGSSDNVCEECSDVSKFIKTEFGLPIGWFVTVVAAVVAAVGAPMYALRSELQRLKAQVKTNLRILLGSAQVLSLLPSVLELVFPPQPKAALSFSAVSVADFRAILRTECWGWSWYDRWMASVFGMPVVAVLPIAAYWLWCRFAARSVDSDSRAELHEAAKVSTFHAFAFVGMLLYPQISSSIFSALRCEQLGEGSAWLEVDYAVSCMPENERYRRYRITALVMVFIVPLGFPMALLAALLWSWRQSHKEWDEDRRQTALDSVTEYHYARVQHLFGFCIEDFRPECFWFEPVDLLRKLALSGLLQFVHRGTAAQCFCGSAIAFTSFGLQQWLRPYRDLESNVLKALVDTQLFLTFLISFILRVLPDINSSEPFGKEVYGWVLLFSMVAVMCFAVGLTIAQIRRHHRFKARLLENEDQLAVLLASGQSDHEGVQQSESGSPATGDVGIAAAARAGLSRPASPAANLQGDSLMTQTQPASGPGPASAPGQELPGARSLAQLVESTGI